MSCFQKNEYAHCVYGIKIHHICSRRFLWPDPFKIFRNLIIALTSWFIIRTNFWFLGTLEISWPFCNLLVYCSCTAWVLLVDCSCTARVLMCTAHVLLEYCSCTAWVLLVDCLSTAGVLMCTACVLLEYCLWTARVLLVYCSCPACVLLVSCSCTDVYCSCTAWVLLVDCLSTARVLLVYLCRFCSMNGCNILGLLVCAFVINVNSCCFYLCCLLCCYLAWSCFRISKIKDCSVPTGLN